MIYADSGDVYVWGSNAWGHLGLGHFNPVTQPTLVPSFAPSNESVVGEGDAQQAITTAAKGVKVLNVEVGFNHTLFGTVPRDSPKKASARSHLYSFQSVAPPYPPPPPFPASVDAPKGRILKFYLFCILLSFMINRNVDYWKRNGYSNINFLL